MGLCPNPYFVLRGMLKNYFKWSNSSRKLNKTFDCLDGGFKLIQLSEYIACVSRIVSRHVRLLYQLKKVIYHCNQVPPNPLAMKILCSHVM